MSSNIVFVVGAGANHVYGFPTGIELIPMVRNYLLKRHGEVNNHDVNLGEELREATNRLDCTTIPSIDLFMQIQSKQNPGASDFVSLFCRRGITRTILEKEAEYLGRHAKKPDWLEYLINEIAAESKYVASEFKNSRIKFITFNYDRLIEYKIRETFIKLLGVHDFGLANNLVNEFSKNSIVHVYGHIGSLDVVDFGANPDDGEVNNLSKNINIIGDRRADEDGKRIVNIAKEASQLHFLGFGFNDENIDQLGLESCPDIRIVSGTCRGVLTAERNRIRYRFWNQLRKRLVLIQGRDDCLEYVKETAEFKPLMGIAHFKSNSTDEVRRVTFNESCRMHTTTGVIDVSIQGLKIGAYVFFGSNPHETFTMLGKFDPNTSPGFPTD